MGAESSQVEQGESAACYAVKDPEQMARIAK